MAAQAFEKLYNETVHKVYKLSLGLMGDANLAKKITQEAMCNLFPLPLSND